MEGSHRHVDDGARPPLLHDHRGKPRVVGAGLEKNGHGVGQLFAGGVVDVGFEMRDGLTGVGVTIDVAHRSASGPGRPRSVRSTRTPVTTWVQLGSSSSSRGPGAESLAGHPHRGHRTEARADSAASSAAPVGVVSSTAMLRPQVGTPSSRATTAGAGLGSMPWAVLTMPSPVATGLARTSSIPSTSRAAAVPTTSTMVSWPPTSWKWTWSTGRRWSRGLDVGQRREGGQGPTGHPVGKAGLFDQPDDVGVGADHHVVVDADHGLRRGDAPPQDRLHLERPAAEWEALQQGQDLAEVGARIQQASERHVPGDAGEAVEPGHRPTGRR